ncbi:hypothetical protein HDU96_007865 [Phlyctochytrium bullatum]|nr:hypothetical protein HDU96_007865 [Phlyctochytrium bullatum]
MQPAGRDSLPRSVFTANTDVSSLSLQPAVIRPGEGLSALSLQTAAKSTRAVAGSVDGRSTTSVAALFAAFQLKARHTPSSSTLNSGGVRLIDSEAASAASHSSLLSTSSVRTRRRGFRSRVLQSSSWSLSGLDDNAAAANDNKNKPILVETLEDYTSPDRPGVVPVKLVEVAERLDPARKRGKHGGRARQLANVSDQDPKASRRRRSDGINLEDLARAVAEARRASITSQDIFMHPRHSTGSRRLDSPTVPRRSVDSATRSGTASPDSVRSGESSPSMFRKRASSTSYFQKVLSRV